MFRLILRSRPAFHIRIGWLVGPLREIAMNGWNEKAESGATGILCIERGGLFQIMEGDRPLLWDAFRQFANDPRHQDLENVAFGPIEAREFDDWAAAFAIPSRLPPGQRGPVDIFSLSASELMARAQLLRATGVVAESPLRSTQAAERAPGARISGTVDWASPSSQRS